MTKPCVVVFDIGSTLIHPDFAILKCWLERRAGLVVSRDTVERAFRLAIQGKLFLHEVKKRSAEANTFFRECGFLRPRDSAALELLWREIVKSGGVDSWLYSVVDPNAIWTLQALRERGVELIAASNSDGTLVEELGQFGLDKCFDKFFDSTILGAKKPSADFYNYVLASAPNCYCVHVGDDLINDGLAALANGFQRIIIFDPANIMPGLPSYFKVRSLTEIPIALDEWLAS